MIKFTVTEEQRRRIRMRCMERGIQYKQLCEACGMSYTQLTQKINGFTKMSLDEWDKIRKAIGE
jgi:transcriptional regulator with XRE-family HTH domain